VENDYVRVRCDKLSMDENTSLCAGSNNNDISSNKHRYSESIDMIDGSEQDSEHALYEESVPTDVSKGNIVNSSDSTLSPSAINISTQRDTTTATTLASTITTTVTTTTATTTTTTTNSAITITTTTSTSTSTDTDTDTDTNTGTNTDVGAGATVISAASALVDKVNQVQTRCIISNRDETCRDSPDLKPILYEQCCDLSRDVNERDRTATNELSRSCLPQAKSDCTGSNTDVPSTVGRCVKVYTPKRRKSVDEARNKLVHSTQCNLVPTTPSSTDSIDLLDEPSANDVPVTLLTSLDMESAEYILSLSAESIQSIVGGTISDQHTVIGCRETNVEQDNADCAKPVLRRSTRLSQQENDETASNGPSLASSATGTEKQFKKSTSPNRVESCAKTKRKGKEDRKVSDHGMIAAATSRKNNNKKTNSRLIVKRNNKTSCTATGGKEKEESKTKANSKFRADNTDRSAILDQSAISIAKSNTHENIDRSLWGDLSDTLDDPRIEATDLLAYPSNTEIPFAVGLLPLRAALEKMQATPDYQPRKTRSSVAPMKQDNTTCTSLKRKNGTSFSDAMVLSKKQNCNNNNESPNTVCHIRIRAATSQCMKSRKRLLSDSITRLPTTEIANNRQ